MNIIADRVVTDFDAECTLPFGNYFLLYNRLLIKIGIFILGKNMFLTDATLLMTIIILGLICQYERVHLTTEENDANVSDDDDL